MYKKLKKMLEQRTAKKVELEKRSKETDNIEELRGINTTLEELNAEIAEIRSALDEIEKEQGNKEPEQSERTAVVNGDVPGVVSASMKSEKRSLASDDMEYRKAFQQFVTRGVAIPAELRQDESTLTTDIGSAIPTHVVDRIVEKLESTGMILPLITKTAFATGVAIPTSSVKPVATWVLEGGSSDRQKKTTGTITFSKFKLRCEISMSVEASTMSIAAFEAAFERQVVEAMVKTLEGTIVSTANGATSPKGILAETPAAGQALQASALSYKLLVDAEAALPQAYEAGAVWCMTKKTFMGFIGMEDAEGQPIARVNYGLGGVPERTLLGRPVQLCGDYMDSFATTLEVGKIFAFIFNFADYTLNTVYDLGVQRKQDWDTEDMLTKAVMGVDGKVVDKNSLVTIAKKA